MSHCLTVDASFLNRQREEQGETDTDDDDLDSDLESNSEPEESDNDDDDDDDDDEADDGNNWSSTDSCTYYKMMFHRFVHLFTFL